MTSEQLSGASSAPPFEIGKAMGAKPSFLPAPIMDDLLTITMQLGAELWVVKDRLRVLEEVLEESGIDAQKRIDEYRPSPERRQEIIKLRDAFVEQIFGALRDRAKQE